MPVAQAVAAAWLIGRFIYHRLTEPDPKKDAPPPKPRTAEGAPIPILFGYCHVDAPVVAWADDNHRYRNANGTIGLSTAAVEDATAVMTRLLFIVGIPFTSGTTTLRLIYADDVPFLDTTYGLTNTTLQSQGDYVNRLGNITICQAKSQTSSVIARVEFLAPSPTKILFNGAGVNGYGSPENYTGFVVAGALSTGTAQLRTPYLASPAYREYATVVMGGAAIVSETGDYPDAGYLINPAQPGVQVIPRYDMMFKGTLPAFKFIMSSYPQYPYWGTGYVGFGPMLNCNPVDALAALLIDRHQGLGLDLTLDYESFRAAARVLETEKNGYSRSIQDRDGAESAIGEILRQIDAVIYYDHYAAVVKLKLIRDDYNPNAVTLLRAENCVGIDGFAVSGWTDIANKVRVTYSSIQNGRFVQASVTAINGTNPSHAAKVEEVVIDMPGVIDDLNAVNLCSREMQARSRPMMKCRATLGPDMYFLQKGDAVAVTMYDQNISGVIFRVVNRVKSDDTQLVTVELLQDYFFNARTGTSGPITPAFPPVFNA